MSAKKGTDINAIEEIERDYKKYKEQFEQWKEANRSAIGTEAYNNYVRQFEAWEKDVEKSRLMVKKKIEQERGAENDDAAAKYAEQHQHYIRMHQKGIAEDSMRSRLSASNLKAHASPLNTSNISNDIMGSMQSALQNVIQSAIKSEIRSPADAMKITSGLSATISAPPLMKSQQVPAPVIQQPVAKPVQLWWTRQAEYGPQDKLFQTFGPRAAPMTTKQPISDNYDYYVPGWLVQREMAENDLAFPSAEYIPKESIHPSKIDPVLKIPSLLSLDLSLPPDFTVPPPIFRSTLPPPTLPSMNQPPPPIHLPLFNPNIPPPSINMPNISMPPPPLIQIGMKRNHSFPGRQMEQQPMHIPPQRG